MFGAKSISKLFLGSMLLIMPAGAFAYVDDAGIMDHFNYANDQCLYDYLNHNDYQLYHKDTNADAYIKNDNSLFMSISTDSLGGFWRKEGMLYTVIMMKPGYKTDKGIEVGMTLKQVKEAYGEIYASKQINIYSSLQLFEQINIA
ncbi:MAG: hypothetical protein SPH51_06130 [Megasphaera elsdenii]|nr:hypothetical protein [Megasphaera elsdenii]